MMGVSVRLPGSFILARSRRNRIACRMTNDNVCAYAHFRTRLTSAIRDNQTVEYEFAALLPLND